MCHYEDKGDNSNWSYDFGGYYRYITFVAMGASSRIRTRLRARIARRVSALETRARYSRSRVGRFYHREAGYSKPRFTHNQCDTERPRWAEWNDIAANQRADIKAV